MNCLDDIKSQGISKFYMPSYFSQEHCGVNVLTLKLI